VQFRLDVPNVGIVDHNLWMGNAQIAQTTSHQPIFLVYFLKQTGRGDKNKKQPWLRQDHLATQTQYLNGETRNQNGGRPAGLYYLGGLSRACSAYPIFGLFFQLEQCFSLTTIQPEQYFQPVSAKIQQAERGLRMAAICTIPFFHPSQKNYAHGRLKSCKKTLEK